MGEEGGTREKTFFFRTSFGELLPLPGGSGTVHKLQGTYTQSVYSIYLICLCMCVELFSCHIQLMYSWTCDSYPTFIQVLAPISFVKWTHVVSFLLTDVFCILDLVLIVFMICFYNTLIIATLAVFIGQKGSANKQSVSDYYKETGENLPWGYQVQGFFLGGGWLSPVSLPLVKW